MSRSTLDFAINWRLVPALALALTALTGCRDDAATAPPTDAAASLALTTVPRSYYVNPATGSNTNAGTSAAPFKTLGRALASAVSGDTVRLAKGSYTNGGYGTISGDVYPLHVKPGVTIRGTLASPGVQGTFLSPTTSAARTTGLILDGSAKLRDFEMGVFGTAIDAGAGTVSARNLNLILNQTAVALHGSAQATLTHANVYLAGGLAVDLSYKARATLDSSVVDFSSTCINRPGIRAGDSTAVTIKNSVLKDVGITAVNLVGNATGTISNTDVTPAASGTCSASPIALFGTARLTMTDVRAPGNTLTRKWGSFVSLQDYSTLTATRLSVSSYMFGVFARGLSNAALISSTIQNNYTGIFGEQGARVTVSGSTFSKNNTGFEGHILKLRGSKMYGDYVGIEAKSSLVDLGRPGDPGNNTFAVAQSHQVRFLPREANQDLPAVGNIWNANIQGAGPDGTYSIASVGSADKLAIGLNFYLQAPNQITVVHILLR